MLRECSNNTCPDHERDGHGGKPNTRVSTGSHIRQVRKGDSVKVLCAGDLHIGRRSSKVPPFLDGPGFSCAAAWSSLVDVAITERVDLVALSGDLVDRDNRYFEAIGPLERGLRRLDSEGIETIVIAGNHDFDVLPRLVDTLEAPHLHFLGRGGDWERFTLQRNGQAVLHVDGRSFVQESDFDNPLDGYSCVADGLPVLGMLHADLDQPQSRYAPVALAELRRSSVSCWLLGHIHKPARYASGVGPPVLYPGSPQAMDPGETGSHGAWIVEFLDDGSIRERQVGVSTIRYESVPVDLTGVETEQAMQSAIVRAIRDALNRYTSDAPALQCLCCRVVLTGRTLLHRMLPGLSHSAQDDLAISVSGVSGVIEKFTFETRPAVDLLQLASRNDPPGEVARMIRQFEQHDHPAEYRELISTTVKRLQSVHQYRPFSAIAADDEPGVSEARDALLREAWSLLDSLVAQKEDA